MGSEKFPSPLSNSTEYNKTPPSLAPPFHVNTIFSEDCKSIATSSGPDSSVGKVKLSSSL